MKTRARQRKGNKLSVPSNSRRKGWSSCQPGEASQSSAGSSVGSLRYGDYGLRARSIQPQFNHNSTSKVGPVFSKLFRLDRTDPLSFGPKFPEILVEWIAPVRLRLNMLLRMIKTTWLFNELSCFRVVATTENILLVFCGLGNSRISSFCKQVFNTLKWEGSKICKLCLISAQSYARGG